MCSSDRSLYDCFGSIESLADDEFGYRRTVSLTGRMNGDSVSAKVEGV